MPFSVFTLDPFKGVNLPHRLQMLPEAGRANDNIGMVLIVFSLGDSDGFVEIFVRESGIDDFVTVIFEV